MPPSAVADPARRHRSVTALVLLSYLDHVAVAETGGDQDVDQRVDAHLVLLSLVLQVLMQLDGEPKEHLRGSGVWNKIDHTYNDIIAPPSARNLAHPCR